MNNVVRNRLFLALFLGASAASLNWRAPQPHYCDVISPSFLGAANFRRFNASRPQNDEAPPTLSSFALRETFRENVKLETASNWSADWLFASERFAPLNLSALNDSPPFSSCPSGTCPFSSVPPTPPQKPTPPYGVVRSIVRVYNAYEETVPAIDAARGQARRRVVEKGSGAIVADSLGARYVLTAAHIFRDGRGEIAAQTTDGRVFPASLLLASEECDVALLSVDAPDDLPALTVSSSWPRQGDTVWRAGFGPDETLKESSGVVKGYVKTDRCDTYETVKINGPARQGDTGGPVYNANGEIVGVVWGTDGVDAYATYCGRVLKTLQDYSPTFAPVAPTLDAAPRTAETPPFPQLTPHDATPNAIEPRVPSDSLKNVPPKNRDALRPAVEPFASAATKFRDFCNAALALTLVFAFGYCGFFASKQR